MANFLRAVRQARWLKYPDVKWLPAGELQADALKDLFTEDGALSVYQVNGEDEAHRVITALAATKERLAVVDYFVFDGSKLPSLDIAMQQQDGETPDDRVNKLHYDIVQLTVRTLASLAHVVSSGEINRIPKKDIKSYLIDAVDKGLLERSKLKSRLLQDLN